jgi:hypothetical protein
MRPTTASSAGYPEDEAFDDPEDYHDKGHLDGVNTLQAQQDLSDVMYKEKWQSQTQHSEQRKSFQHLGKLGCSRTIESLVFDIRSLDRRSPEDLGENASGPQLHQTLTLVSTVRDASDCMALDVEQKGRDYSDQVTRTGGIDALIGAVFSVCALDNNLSQSFHKGPEVRSRQGVLEACMACRAALRSIVLAVKGLVTAPGTEL